MICLLKNLTDIQIQEQSLPSKELLTARIDKGMDLSILKICYNMGLHDNLEKINDSTYNSCWMLACTAIPRLGGLSFYDKCKQIENMVFVEQDEDDYSRFRDIQHKERKMEIHFLQLFSVCSHVVPSVIKKVFDKEFKSVNLRQYLPKIESMRVSKKIKNELQALCMRQDTSFTKLTSADIDWRIMLVLLEQHFHEKQEARSTGKQLEDLKRRCNEVFHLVDGRCTDKDFNRIWKIISDAVGSLSDIDCSKWKKLNFYSGLEEASEETVAGVVVTDEWEQIHMRTAKGLKHMQVKGQTPSTSKMEKQERNQRTKNMFDFSEVTTPLKRRRTSDVTLTADEGTKRLKKDTSTCKESDEKTSDNATAKTVIPLSLSHISRQAKDAETATEFQENGFFNFNLLCDGRQVDCILPAICEKQHIFLCKKGGLEHILTGTISSDRLTRFEELLQAVYKKEVLGNPSLLDKILQYSVKRDHLLLFVYLMQNTINEYNIGHLTDLLHYAIEANSLQTAKNIGCRISRCFYHRNKQILRPAFAIWVGLDCSCDKNEGRYLEGSCRSQKPKIVVETKLDIDANKLDFQNCPLGIKIVKFDDPKHTLESREVVNELINQFEGQIITGNLQSDVVDRLFNSHSNLTVITPSKLKSIGFKNNHVIQKANCVQLYCSVKGMVPIAEKHFSLIIDDMPTDVLQAVPTLSSVRIGDQIGSSKKYGTVGGFAKIYGYDAILTCAHVIFDEDILLNDDKIKLHEHHHEIIYHSQPSVSPCRVIKHKFSHDNPNKTSIDAALIAIPPRCSRCAGAQAQVAAPATQLSLISQSDIACGSFGQSIHYSNLGMTSCYLNTSFVDVHKLVQNIRCLSFAATTGQQESPVTVDPNKGGTDVFLTMPTALQQQGNPLPVYQPSLPVVTQMQRQHNTHQASTFSSLNFPITLLNEVHVRAFIEILKRDGIVNMPKVTMFKQFCVLNYKFQQGDSGTCIYTEKGCIAMAVADFPCGCIATPIGEILRDFRIA